MPKKTGKHSYVFTREELEELMQSQALEYLGMDWWEVLELDDPGETLAGSHIRMLASTFEAA